MTGVRSRLRRLSKRRIVLLLVLGVLGWLAIGVWQLLGARDALQDGADALQSVRRGATVETLLEPSTTDRLDAAEDRFESARDRLRSPLVTPLRALPVVGRHVRAADRVEVTAREATEIAGDGVEDLRELEARGSVKGSARVDLVRDLGSVLTSVRTRLAELDPGSSDALVRSLHDAIDDLRAERDDAVVGLDRARRTTDAVASLLEGPGTYLVLGANNAEMRADSGMFLTAAPLAISDGTLVLGEVRSVVDLVQPEGSVPVEGDLARNWPWLDPGRDPRQLGLTPDFPQSAAVAREWWARVPGGGEVDGVLSVDVGAVRELLRVVGPVEVDGVRYEADTVAAELLRRQYRRAGDDSGATEARRDRLGDVARAVFEKVESGGWEVDGLASTLVELVQRRHLIVWSADADVQTTWQDVGAGGALEDDSLSVALLNRGGEKLDPYLTVEAEVTTVDGAVTIETTITNDAPADGPRYQIGPNAPGLEAGDHRGILVVNLPAGTTAIELTGGSEILRSTDGPTEVVAAELVVARGETVTVRVDARLADGVDRLVIEPSARLPGTRWIVDGRAFEVDRRRSVSVAGT